MVSRRYIRCGGQVCQCSSARWPAKLKFEYQVTAQTNGVPTKGRRSCFNPEWGALPSPERVKTPLRCISRDYDWVVGRWLDCCAFVRLRLRHILQCLLQLILQSPSGRDYPSAEVVQFGWTFRQKSFN